MGLEAGGGTLEEEKIPLGESIGHRPLRGRCPKRSQFLHHRFIVKMRLDPSRLRMNRGNVEGGLFGFLAGAATLKTQM